MRSSYEVNDYAKIFNAIVDVACPRVCVELGVLDGYSSVAIGKALKQNGGHLDSWDLFEDYQFKHSTMSEVQNVLANNEITDYVTLRKGDAYKAHEYYQNHSVQLLHVDISNDGDTIDKIMVMWDEKIHNGGLIIFEGGTEERDNVEWMVKYNKPSIKKALESNKIIKDNYVFCTYLAYPGLTVLLKRR
jgi:predicted O-methyltransferase YrrM